MALENRRKELGLPVWDLHLSETHYRLQNLRQRRFELYQKIGRREEGDTGCVSNNVNN
eukprot:m.187746 g.187746  ORF g.187746 m.187746 type:complete len:58 (-) comp25627_c1_seq9:110-283(-)